MVQEICLKDQAMLGKSNKAVLQAKKANLVSSTLRVSGEPSISQFGRIYYFSDLSKSIQSCQFEPHIIKI